MGGGPDAPARAPASAAERQAVLSTKADNSSTETSSPKSLEFTVLVTGFGPFPDGEGGQFDDNASHLLTKLLPSVIKFDTSPTKTGSPAMSKVKVSVLNPTAEPGAYVRTEYAYIRSYVEELYLLHDGHPRKRSHQVSAAMAKDVSTKPSESEESRTVKKPRIDLFLHIGMASGWNFVTVERRAYRQDMTTDWWDSLEKDEGYYLIPDNAGKTVRDAGPCPWKHVPMGLSTDFNVDGIVERANETLSSKDSTTSDGSENARKGKRLLVKAHHEAGSYGCGFIYYESLAQSHSRGWKKNVLFCHVPGETDDATLKKGRDAIVAVIEAAVYQMVETRGKAVVG